MSERPIRILPPHVVNRIAAGEVVERPASVVKELVENALDAGATRIEIAVSAEGRNIRVADNGSGMTAENAALAFFNHATSKIADEADLDCIQTLGFRGEALASIGAISRLTCLTRTPDSEKGHRITLDAEGNPQITETGCAPGTVMEVAELFYNTPARLKFLKRAATELGHIEEAVQYLALSHPEVRFSLRLNDREALKTSGSGELKQAMEEVFNLKREQVTLVPIAFEDGEAGLSLAGYASTPGFMKSARRWMVTFVNGRHVRCPLLQKAIEAAYESLLPHDKYPLCVLFINMPPRQVDVNVHPAKREVRYASGNTIFAFVRQGIRAALERHGLSFEPAYPVPSGEPGMAHSGAFVSRPGGLASRPALPPPAFRSGPVPSQAVLDFYRPAPDASQGLPAPVGEAVLAEADLGASSGLPAFKVIGQLFNTYILLETAQGLMVVDQHIASERTFFEALTLNLTGEAPDIQHLVMPVPVAVGPAQRELLERHCDDFARLGFLYAVDENGHGVQLTGLPLIYAGRDGLQNPGACFEGLLTQLEETGRMALDLDHLIATLSCHSAVRAGDPLEAFEMDAVIRRWLACRLPWTCPHGRPIAHTISKNELNHFFHRPSLPANAL